jgi:hypothetical protein
MGHRTWTEDACVKEVNVAQTVDSFDRLMERLVPLGT